jgi:chromosome partitioning protein
MVEPNALRILVVNGKGGCGKTTIATNLAAANAHQGHGVALIDHDSQASSSHWLSQRAPEQPSIYLVQAHQRTAMYATRSFQQRLPNGTHRIIIDTPSVVGDAELDHLLRGISVILVPVLPSSLDIRAADRFLKQLTSHRLLRGRPVPIATIANRVRPNTLGHTRLKEFLAQLDVPTAATFRDRTIYMRLADQGKGVVDVPEDREAAAEFPQWQALLDWIDASDTSRRANPARATRHHSRTYRQPA